MDTPCREYQGNRSIAGYGRLNRRRPDGTIHNRFVHRFVWEQIYGPVPPGMVVMHLCDNPPCFRLDHLRLGTQAENLADMHAKGRDKDGDNAAHRVFLKPGRLSDRTHCKHGHERTPENTYIDPRRGWKCCRICKRASERRRKDLRRRGML